VVNPQGEVAVWRLAPMADERGRAGHGRPLNQGSAPGGAGLSRP
jgi:hypothetical protein